MRANVGNRRTVMIGISPGLSLFLTLLLIVGCARNPQGQQHSENTGARGESKFACGTVGNLVLKLPSRNTFLGMIYEGEDYWLGTGEKDRERTCGDRLLEASIALTWPDMAAEGASPGLPAGKGHEVIVLSVKPEDIGDDKFVLNKEAIRGIDFEKSSSVWNEITQPRKWNQPLGMYCMPGRSTVNREVCWNEGADGSVRTLVICNQRPSVEPALCTQSFLMSNADIKVEIGYQGNVKPQWQLLEESSIKFIESHVLSAEGSK